MTQLPTKDDLTHFVTKDDLQNFALKDDLKNFTTKDDLLQLEQRLNAKCATKGEHESTTQQLLTFIGDVHKDLKKDINKLDKRCNQMHHDIVLIKKELGTLAAYKNMSDDHETRLFK